MKILQKIKKIIPNKFFKKLQPSYHYLLSWFAALIYRFPSQNLIVIGVTGTTGKTTSVYLIAKMLKNAGYKVGYTSTAMFHDGKKEWLNDKKMTMVGRFFTQKILRDMVRNDCQYAIVETTSEGIVQYRHKFIDYDILVFTGLYPEHIDSHGGFENYKEAKGRLFAHLKKCRKKYVDENKKVISSKSGIKKLDLNRIRKTIIANLDDDHVDYFLDFWAEEKLAYVKDNKGRGVEDKIKVVDYGDIQISEGGMSFKIDGKRISLQLLGDFNVANSMNAYCIGLSQELGFEKIKEALGNISGVPGRLEKINKGQKFTVIVDYAFEPKAVTKLYETIDLIPHNKIIHVLGSAGGGRDVARRPKLGQLAGEIADYVIVTNEDPYDDDPLIIIDQVATGAEHEGKELNKDLFKILDRKEAIQKAINLAEEGDIVLITGKGSEQGICVADGEMIPWDDREIVKDALKAKSKI